MEEQESRKDRNREKIIRAALELFEQFGFNKVSVNDVAEKAGVSPVTIYNHFGNKDELIRESVKTLSQDFLDRAREIIRSERPFIEKLDKIIFDKTSMANKYRGELIQSAIKNDPEIYKYVLDLRRNEADELMFELFEEGKKQGLVNPRMSKEGLLLYCEILRQGIYSVPSFSEQTRKNPELMREIISLAVYGLNG